MERPALIATDVLARYAADAACEVASVRGVVESARSRPRGVRVTDDAGVLALELHLSLDWGADVTATGRAVQTRVADYLGRMAEVESVTVDVVFDEIGPPPASSA